MTYVPTNWQNFPSLATAITAARLNNIEQGIVNALVSGVIVNADVAANAAIAYSKLNLALGIVNGDISASAAISFSKLTGVAPLDGWAAMTQTLTYSSVDGPTGVVTTGGVDLTSVIPVGAWLKFTQTTVKKFKVTAIDATTITFYGGTDFTLVNAAITLPSYSLVKSPVGVDTSPAKWAETLKDTSSRSQASPTSGTWYNPGSLTLAFPIGAWIATFTGSMQGIVTAPAAQASNQLQVRATLSTANNSESDSDLTSSGFAVATEESLTNLTAAFPFARPPKTIVVAAKTSYFANVTVSLGSNTFNSVALRGDQSPTIIRAVCAYL